MIIPILILISLIFLLFNIICLHSYDKLSSIAKNKFSFINFLFIGLFGVEQIIFLIASFYYKSNLIIGLFSIIVITTAAYQKFLMDIKLKNVDKDKAILNSEYEKLLSQYIILNNKIVN